MECVKKTKNKNHSMKKILEGKLNVIESVIGREKRMKLEQKSAGTQTTYHQIITSFIKWAYDFGVDIENSETACREYISCKLKESINPKTLNKISSCFRFLFDCNLGRFSVKTSAIEILKDKSVEKVRSILKGENEEMWLAFEILRCTGVRIGELSRLKKRNFLGNGKLLVKARKGKKDRYVFVSEEIEEIIKLKENGQIFRDIYFGSRFNSLLKDKSGNKNFTAHKLRHYCCSKLVNENIFNLVEARDYMGHSNVSVTDVYLHANLNKMKEKFFNKFS